MKSFALNINSGRSSNSSVAVEAHLVDFNSTQTRVFNLYNLIQSWFGKPLVSNLVVKYHIPDTLLTKLVLVLFAGGKDYQKGSNRKYFHNESKRGLKMELTTRHIKSALCSNGNITREAVFFNANNAGASVFYFSKLIGRRLVYPAIFYLVVDNNIPVALTPFIFFAGNNSDDYNGNGDD
jgi:hypothetical protein